MKKLFLTVILTLAGIAAMQAGEKSPTGEKSRAERIAEHLKNPKSEYVVVVVHRGDWRNYPENSIPAMESIIRMGADMMELDIKMTKDSVLVVSHDKTLNRCTNGKGLISETTYAEIRELRLKRAHGITTDSLHMPTLREALLCCKDRICVNVDHGYELYDQVLELAEELGVTEQILIKGRAHLAEHTAKTANHPNNLMYMPIVSIPNANSAALMKEYEQAGVVPMAYEVCWNQTTETVTEGIAKILSKGSKLWVNTIWGSLCGYLDDDAALAESLCSGTPAAIYNQVLNLGASIIQTDRPQLLIPYLESIGRHTL